MTDVQVRQPVPLRTVGGVQLAAVGTWKASTGETTFTPEDFANAVAALDCPGVRNPVIKLGHDEPDSTSGIRWDGEPALGWIGNMHVDGAKLVGDYVGMPSWLTETDENGMSVLASAYPDRSIEIYRPFTCQIGHLHPAVITAVALLGVSRPGIGVLQSMQDVYAAYTQPMSGDLANASALLKSEPGYVRTTVRMAAAERRDLTEAERRAGTDFARLEKDWENALDSVLAQWPDISAGQRDQLRAQIETAVDAQTDGLGRLTVDAAAATAAIAAAMAALADRSIAEQVAEAQRQGVPLDPYQVTTPDLDRVAASVAASMAASTASVAGRTAAQKLGTGDGATIAADTMAFLSGLSDRFLRDQIGGALSAAQLAGRLAVLKVAPEGEYYASEVADSNACAPCRSIDGKRFGSLDEAEAAYGSGKYVGCLAGARCRGQLVTVWNVDVSAASAFTTTVRKSIGDLMATALTQASVSVEDISRQYYETAGYSMWITAMHVNPLELIASDDSTGKFFRIPVELKGEAFTFGEPQEVAIVYQDVKAAASALPYRWRDRKSAMAAAGVVDPTPAPPTLILDDPDVEIHFKGSVPKPEIAPDVTPAGAAIRQMAAATKTPDASPATGSTQTSEEASGMSVDAAKLREALGLAADAPESDVSAALASAFPTTPAATSTPPPAEPTPSSMLSAIPSNADAIVLDKANYQELVNLARKGETAFEAMKAGQRDAFLSQAVKDGRFPPARLSAYEQMWDKNPDEARAFIELMPKNSIPVMSVGFLGAAENSNEADAAYEALYGKGN